MLHHAEGMWTAFAHPCIIYQDNRYANDRQPSWAIPVFFYSFDCNERIHVHVQRERMTCKFWIQTVALAKNHGFAAKELNTIRGIIADNRKRIMEAWYEHCGADTRSEN